MPVEENKELRDLVKETLQAKGVLGKVQAEIRASVFLALEEKDVFKDRSPFSNKALKEFLNTSSGLIVISLVREFFDFFNLEFTSMVFDPETHAGIDFTFKGREEILKELKFAENDLDNQPLLGYIFNAFKTESFKENDKEVNTLQGSVDHSVNGSTNGDVSFFDKPLKIEAGKKSTNIKQMDERLQKEESTSKEPQLSSLTSLSNLPPLNKQNAGGKDKPDSYNLKALLDVGISNSNYEEEFIPSLKNEKLNKDSREEAESDESDIEEDISRHTNVSGIARKKKGSGRKRIIPSCEGDGDKISGAHSNLICLTSLSDLPPITNKPTKLDYGPMTTSIIPPTEIDDKDISESSTSERLEMDQSRCDTISEVEEIEEELSMNTSVSDENILNEYQEKETGILSEKENNTKMMGFYTKDISCIDNPDVSDTTIIQVAKTEQIENKFFHKENKNVDEPKRNAGITIDSCSNKANQIPTKLHVENNSFISQKQPTKPFPVFNDKDKGVQLKYQQVQRQGQSSQIWPTDESIVPSSQTVLIGGTQLSKEDYKSIFQDLERDLGAKIESIYIPDQRPDQSEVIKKKEFKSDTHFKDSSKRNLREFAVTKEVKDQSTTSESLSPRSDKSTRQSSSSITVNISNETISGKRADPTSKATETSSSSKKLFSKGKRQEPDKEIKSEKRGNREEFEKKSSDNERQTDSSGNLKSHSSKHETPKSSFKENSLPSKKSGNEKEIKMDSEEFDSFFKFGVDTSYEEFCRFKKEMLKRKGFSVKIENDSSNSFTSSPPLSPGRMEKQKFEQKCAQKEEDVCRDMSSVDQKSRLAKNLSSLKTATSSKKKGKPREKNNDSTHKMRSRNERSPSTESSSDNPIIEQEERTQDISVSTASGVGDYMEPVSLSIGLK